MGHLTEMGNHRVRFGLQFATAPICSGTRSGSGWEIGPWCRCPEIARPCGAAVRQERPSGQPGGLFLLLFAVHGKAANGFAEINNAARAEYDRQAALITCRAPQIPRPDTFSTGIAEPQFRENTDNAGFVGVSLLLYRLGVNNRGLRYSAAKEIVERA